jgi:Tol biopolymer transport system component
MRMPSFGTLLSAVVALATPARGQQIRCLSLDAGGTDAASGSEVAVSADGRFVAFVSISGDLVAGDTNGDLDVFVRDRTTGAIERVSVASDGTEGSGVCTSPALSDDGRYVVFASESDSLVADDTNHTMDVFLRDRQLGTTTRLSVSSSGEGGDAVSTHPAISGDGGFVAFESAASNFAAGDSNQVRDIFVRDLAAGTTTRISLSTTGGNPDKFSQFPAISGDGRYVAFLSDATNLVSGDTNRETDVFLFDRDVGTTARVSVSSSGAQANGKCGYVGMALSRDGSTVAFDSFATNLASGDSTNDLDVFVRDLAAGTTECVSVRSDGGQVTADCTDPTLSADGRLVAFVGRASDLVDGDTNNRDDVFVHDRASGTTVFGDQTCAGNLGDGDSREPALDGAGDLLVFSSWSDDLTDAHDHNAQQDVFANDLSFQVDAAAWSNYGAGWPGELGIPSLTASAPPSFGSTLTLDVTNSTSFYTIGFLLLGLDAVDVPTRFDGALLVDFVSLQVLVLDPATTSLPVTVPRDESLCNVSIRLQVIEEDEAASRAFSFTPGLELHVGR